MMIKITQKCSMGCTHCMNRATKDGGHMDFSTFISVIDFQKKNGGPICFFTGGEPFEHPLFWSFLGYAMSELSNTMFIVATNGLALAEPANAKIVEEFATTRKPVEFQVSTDKRYYPIQIDLSLPVYHLDNVTLITEIPKLYPQGRTMDNNLPWTAIGSKCCNVRGMARQIKPNSVVQLIATMLAYERMCTPHIDINGIIKLGESDLCPACSSIYKTDKEIVSDIMNFSCHGCDHVNKNLPRQMKEILGVTI